MNHGGGESTEKSESRRDESSGRSGAEDFGRTVSKIAVAQICESVGFEGFKDSALDTLADIAIRYICDLGKTSSFNASLAGRTECNFFDIIRGIEDLEVLKGFTGASEIGQCLVGSGTVREIIEFVESNEEIPFAQPIPRFPVIKNRRLIPSFVEMNETPPGKHIPSWLPAFPDPHTYIHTPMWNERKSDPRADKIEQARQRRKAEMALLSLQQRLVCNGETGTSASVPVNDKEEEIPETGSNPFLAKPLQSGEKDISPIALPAKLKDEVLGVNHVTVMDAFAPAIEAVKSSGFSDDGDGDRKSLPDKRPAVHFNFRTSKKFLGEFLDSTLQKGNGRSTSFGRDEEKDDKKRRAEYILKQSMENPQELTQL
ncbi:transcription initiation factor TFIID subunit 8-like [Melia azedarach]|uniref:Transcription initiation factor TFIID subunit 8-like n=1 Tax=Melia azedarach TaxID=155640 RepID=A0ACC1X1N2_MELAZ|nr:transcription initiation factor TFIID subunit 8-like [Melia azedarach]